MRTYSGYCLAIEFKPHLATRRSGYCDTHHEQYTREKKRWQSSLNNYRRGKTPNDPGPWVNLLKEIKFLPLPNETADATRQDHRTDTAPATLDTGKGDWNINIPPHLRKQLAQLAEQLDTGLLEIEQAATFAPDSYSKRWATHIHDRATAMRLSASVMRFLSEGETPRLPRQ